MNDKFHKIKIFLILTLCLFTLLGCVWSSKINKQESSSSTSNNLKEVVFKSNNDLILKVEIADTEVEREEGLMNRTFMPENQGMIFIFEQEMDVTFWMKNTLIPLDIIFINSNGEIVHIAQNTKVNQTTEVYPSQYPIKYAIEVNANWTKNNNIAIGNKVDLSNIVK